VRVGVIGRADRLVPRLRAGGIEPVVHTPATLGQNTGVATVTVGDYQAFFEALEHPRVFLLDLEPGPGVDAVIDEAYASWSPATSSSTSPAATGATRSAATADAPPLALLRRRRPHRGHRPLVLLAAGDPAASRSPPARSAGWPPRAPSSAPAGRAPPTTP
jgi:hypothetical protein